MIDPSRENASVGGVRGLASAATCPETRSGPDAQSLGDQALLGIPKYLVLHDMMALGFSEFEPCQ